MKNGQQLDMYPLALASSSPPGFPPTCRRALLPAFIWWPTSVSSDLSVWEMRTSLDQTDNVLIGYIRVSTRKQAQSGQGFEAQRRQIESFAKRAGLPLAQIFHDVESASRAGSIRQRTGWKDALCESRRRKAPIVVADCTRVTRSVEDFEYLREQPDVCIVDSSLPSSIDNEAKMVARIRRGQDDAARIKRRTSEALNEKRRKGVQLGNRTNLRRAQSRGAAKNKQLAEERDSLLAVQVDALVAKGIKTRTKIAEELNRIGYAAPRGGSWTANDLKRPLRRIRARQSPPSSSGTGGSPSSGPSEADLLNPSWGTW